MDHVQKKGVLRGVFFMRKTFVIFSITCCIFLSLSLSAYAGTRKAVIDTPNPCTKVEKIEGKSVYLKSHSESCIQVIGKEVIEVDNSIKNVSVYLDGTYWNEQEVKDFSIESIPELKRSSEGYLESIKTDNVHMDKMKKLAGEAARYYQSEEYQKKIKAETERIKGEVFGTKLEGYYPGRKQEEKVPGKLSSSERIYIFVSSSMPLETLRAYVGDVSGLKDDSIVFVMRGFIGGMKFIRPTIDFIAKALVTDKHCDLGKQKCEVYNVNFEIDPLLFRKYGITRVPAFVYVPHIEVEDSERSEGSAENARVSDFFTLYGDAFFEYILETFQKEIESASIGNLINAFKKGFD